MGEDLKTELSELEDLHIDDYTYEGVVEVRLLLDDELVDGKEDIEDDLEWIARTAYSDIPAVVGVEIHER